MVDRRIMDESSIKTSLSWTKIDKTRDNEFVGTWYKDPIGMSCEMTTKLGGELQHPMTGMTLGWEKILEDIFLQ